MTPAATETLGIATQAVPTKPVPALQPPATVQSAHTQVTKLRKEPIQLSGALDHYHHIEMTPVIGREYPDLQAKDLLHAPNSDELLRELGTIIARRGVVFLRKQDLTPDEQKDLTIRLAQAVDSYSGTHIHPLMNAQRDSTYLLTDRNGSTTHDDEISVIHSKFREDAYKDLDKTGAQEWHSDITFEPAPASFTSLKIHTTPDVGGDTLWSSGYEIYDRLSPPVKELLSKLEGRFAQPFFNSVAQAGNLYFHKGPRGHPDNVGELLEAHHPIVRTNPVTGWRSIFSVGTHFDRFKGLNTRESEILKTYLLELVTSTHAAQARFRWEEDSLAIWDNRSTFHAATPDLAEGDTRVGVRVVATGERPYFDAASVSRRDALGSKLI